MQTVADLGERCTGCGACACACLSIEMLADGEGFFYPSIDDKKCTHCGKCLRLCPVATPGEMPKTQGDPNVYAAWSLNEDTRVNSTSGGIFTELAKAVIEKNGWVVGARYINPAEKQGSNTREGMQFVEHMLIDKVEDIFLLRQSKYVQSNINGVFIKIEKALKSKGLVLFVGTPCQCAGLIGFLGKAYSNLILCDFICRGVNSPLIYAKYLGELEDRYGSPAKQVWFKNKTYGWNKFGTKILFENGQAYFGGRDTDSFMYGYIKKDLNLYMRPCCTACDFKGLSRAVDITLGDFWGVQLAGSADDTEKGVSAVMVHSEKGRELLSSIKDRVYLEQQDLKDLWEHNKCLTVSPKRNETRKLFWRMVNENQSFETIIEELKRYESPNRKHL